MAKVTWLGEDVGDHPGPSFVIWQGIKFPKGKGVEIPEGPVLAKARGNRFFKVGEPKQIAGGSDYAIEGKPDAKTTQAAPAPKAEPKAEEPKAAEPQKSGYAPAKKKVRKPKAAHHSAHR